MQVAVGELLARVSGRIANPVEAPDRLDLGGLSELKSSKNGDVAFFFSERFASQLAEARPSVLITGEAFVPALSTAGLSLWTESLVIACPDPYLGMARVSEIFAPESDKTFLHSVAKATIEPGAMVDPRAELGQGVLVRSGAVIEAHASIGPGTCIGPGCWVGEGAAIGASGHLIAHVMVYPGTVIGDFFRAHAGAVIGSDGFGYAPIKEGRSITGHAKIWHLGRAVIGDRVEIGANSCVDRGTFGETIIEDDVKIDNQCHVGHNSRVGRGAILCGGVLLAGSVTVGQFVYIGGNCGISNHVHIGDGGRVGAMSLITKDIAPGTTATGNPQREYSEHFRAQAALSRLSKKRVRPQIDRETKL